MEWKWSKKNEKSLASFVTDEAVKLLRLPESYFDLILQKPEGRLKLIEVIYNTLVEKNIYYTREKYDPDDDVQLIRDPTEILESPRVGTCLDLALLFCGLCFGYDLLPLIVIIQDHALVAVSLNLIRHKDKWGHGEWNSLREERTRFNKPNSDLFAGEDDLEYLRNLIDNEAYVAIECTGFARTQSFKNLDSPEAIGRNEAGFLPFERAVKAGREQLDNPERSFQFALDIAVAQYGWKIGSFDFPLNSKSVTQTSFADPPFFAGDPPEPFVKRPQELEKIIAKLVPQSQTQPNTVTVLYGPGGCGKTTLAQAVCHNSRIKQDFTQGIYWVPLGQEEKAGLKGMKDLYYRQLLSNSDSNSDTGGEYSCIEQNLELITELLQKKLEGKRCLVVLDDLWSSDHLQNFLKAGKSSFCTWLVTTQRLNSTEGLPHYSKVHIQQMSREESFQLLKYKLPLESEQGKLQNLADKLYEFPLLINLVRKKIISKMAQYNMTVEEAIDDVSETISGMGVTCFEDALPNELDKEKTVIQSLRMGFFKLLNDDEQERFKELLIFLSNVEVPLCIIEILWNQSKIQVKNSCEKLDGLSLIKYNFHDKTIFLDEFVREYWLDYDNKLIEKLPSIHNKLLEAYKKTYQVQSWIELSKYEGTYLWDYLVYHLKKAGRREEAQELLQKTEKV